MQMMSDHVMTRDEVVQHVRKMFERLDTNHDGYVTREEANAISRGSTACPSGWRACATKWTACAST